MAKFKRLTINTSGSMNLDIQLSDFLSPGDPCELIKQLVMELDTESIESTYSNIGQRGYHPKMLLSVIFYGYSQGLRSGRKLSQACKTDIRYIYLSQGYRPGKSTFNDFRKNHHQSFEGLFKQVVEKCIDLGVAQPQGPSYGDGSKIRANASSKRSKTKETYEKWLKHLQADIEELQSQITSDDDESDKELKKDLLSKSALEDKLRDRLEGFESDSDQQKINATDPDALFMKGKKGNKDTYYNPQIVVDANQIILHNHVCDSSSDRRQLKDCLEGFKRNLGYTQFLLRTLPKVQAEFNIMCIAYNLAKVALWRSKEHFLTLFKRLRGPIVKNADRLICIVNELCASFFRCLYI